MSLRLRDLTDRPELHSGCIEFVAATEYMVRPPQPPVYLFLVEASYTAVASGMLRCVSATLQHTLARLPGGERTQVGLITFDSTLHFYNCAGGAPQMHVVSEIDEVFLPMPDDLLVNAVEARDVLTGLFEKLPSMFAANQVSMAWPPPAQPPGQPWRPPRLPLSSGCRGDPHPLPGRRGLNMTNTRLPVCGGARE